MSSIPPTVSAASFGAPSTGDFSEMKALIVDDNNMSRITLASVLRDCGIGRIKTVPGTHQARVHLQANTYDVILCEYHFSGPESGQDLLDEIRYTRMVPFRTVFFMVTGEATYERVAEVVENAPDDYLLKPFKPAALEERLHKALAKKVALLPIYQKMEAKDFEGALSLCKKTVRELDTYWLDAARIGAELSLYLKRHKQAQAFFDIVLKAKALPWAKLGLAQLAYSSDDAAKARGTLEALVSNTSAYADAYDLLARIYFEEGQLSQALDTLRRGVEATPANLQRLQKLGSLAYFVGEATESEAMLGKAFRLGFGSRAFDLQSVLQLALLAQARGASAKDIERFCLTLETALAKTPDDFRLSTLTQIAQVCAAMARKNPAEVVQRVKAMEGWLEHPEFDFECACNLLSLLGLVGSQEIRLPDAPLWVQRTARRHCISKTAADLLCASLGGLKELIEIVEKEQAQVTFQANDAMSRLLKGDADGTALRLTQLARETLNARLFGLAESLAIKHRERLSDASMSLILQAQEVRQKYCSRGTQVSLARMAEAGRTAKTLPLP